MIPTTPKQLNVRHSTLRRDHDSAQTAVKGRRRSTVRLADAETDSSSALIALARLLARQAAYEAMLSVRPVEDTPNREPTP